VELKREKCIIIGPSASGKDYLKRKFSKRGLKALVKYTTRPMREGEIDGVEYRFVSQETFHGMLKNSEFLLHQEFEVWPKDKEPYYIGAHKVLLVTPKGIRLPNGLYIQYPELTWDTSEEKGRYKYKSRRGYISVWGGSVVENVIQALARIVIGEQIIKISDKYRPVLTVHDSVVCIAPKAEIKEAVKYITDIMSMPPDWGTTLPIACEAGYGDSYGDC